MSRKIVLVDNSLDGGHHLNYLSSLTSFDDVEFVLIAPQSSGIDGLTEYILPANEYNTRSLAGYKRYVVKVFEIANVNAADCVHFLNGDIFYRFFGLYLSRYKGKIVMTFHHMKRSFIRNISFKRIFKKICYGVVHTESLMQYLNSIHIKNVHHIEYPVFENIKKISSLEAKALLNIPTDRKLLLAIGGTRIDKGLDILLDALGSVKEPFYLLIAGSTNLGFSEEFIDEKSFSYSSSVFKRLYQIPDEEWNLCLNACDIVVLPYRKSFDGASGPLAEGVVLEKQFIGPDHGSLNHIISTYSLGTTFKSEDAFSLSSVISTALNKDAIAIVSEYKQYQKKLTEKRFRLQYKKLYDVLLKG